MKAAAQASPSKDLKLKALAKVAPSDDEETYSGLVFKRRRKDTAEHVEHSASDGRVPSPLASNASTYLEKTLLFGQRKTRKLGGGPASGVDERKGSSH